MKRLLRVLSVAVALASALGAPAPAAMAQAGAGDAGATDQIIVTYRSAEAAAKQSAGRWSALAGETLSRAREFGDRGHVLKLKGRASLTAVAEIAKRLAADPDVEYAEPDQIMRADLTPNDPSYTAEQWDLFAPAPGLYGANLPGAWDITTGSASLNIAVIDTGIRPHADLAGRYIGGYDFISTLAVANDGNLRDSDPSDPGDWTTAGECGPGSTARNSSWHGTHVAGTIGAATNNGSGVAGINWVSKIVPVRVLGKCGGYTSDIVDGVRWAAGLSVAGVPANANPARVLNLSLGGSGACSTTWQNGINDAVNAGAVVVVAAGNSNADAANYSPASCAGVITVAATGKAGNRASYSNFGTAVEIAAPGGDSQADGGTSTIYSTLNAGTTTPGADSYAYYEGTSMATPHVVGIVSLVLSVNPALTPAQVTALLQTTATAFPAGSTCSATTCGAGIINAAAAVAAAGNVTPQPPGPFGKTSPSNGATKRQTSLTLSWGASSGAVSYEYCRDTTNGNTCASAWTSVGAANSVAISGLSRGTTYYWQVRAVNATGTTEANADVWWRFTTR